MPSPKDVKIGTFAGASCSPGLRIAVEDACAPTGWTRVTDGRFKGGWITRHYGEPEHGVHAVQMELAMRGYLDEVLAAAWPPAWSEARAGDCIDVLRLVLSACLEFAERPPKELQ